MVRSRLYRSRLLKVDARWKALNEIYKIYIVFVPLRFQEISKICIFWYILIYFVFHLFWSSDFSFFIRGRWFFVILQARNFGVDAYHSIRHLGFRVLSTSHWQSVNVDNVSAFPFNSAGERPHGAGSFVVWVFSDLLKNHTSICQQMFWNLMLDVVEIWWISSGTSRTRFEKRTYFGYLQNCLSFFKFCIS